MGVWDTRERKLVKAFPDSRPLRISPRCFALQKQQMVLPGKDNSAIVFDINNWSVASTLPAVHTAPITKAVFSPDENRIATISMDRTCVVWEASTSKMLARFAYAASDARQTDVEFTGSSEHLVVWGDNGSDIYSLRDFSLKSHRSERTATVSSFDENLLLLDEGLNTVTLVNAQSGTSLAAFRSSSLIRDMALVRNTDAVAIMTEREIELHYLQNSSQSSRLFRRLRGHDDILSSMCVRSNKGQIASLGWDNTLRIWDVKSDRDRRTFSSRISETVDALVARSPNGQHVAFGNVTGDLSIVVGTESSLHLNNRLPGRALLGLSNQSVLCMEPGKASLFDVASQAPTSQCESARSRRRHRFPFRTAGHHRAA